MSISSSEVELSNAGRITISGSSRNSVLRIGAGSINVSVGAAVYSDCRALSAVANEAFAITFENCGIQKDAEGPVSMQ